MRVPTPSSPSTQVPEPPVLASFVILAYCDLDRERRTHTTAGWRMVAGKTTRHSFTEKLCWCCVRVCVYEGAWRVFAWLTWGCQGRWRAHTSRFMGLAIYLTVFRFFNWLIKHCAIHNAATFFLLLFDCVSMLALPDPYLSARGLKLFIGSGFSANDTGLCDFCSESYQTRSALSSFWLAPGFCAFFSS